MGRPRVLTDEQRAANKKACAAATYVKNKAKILARQAARYAANPEIFKARHTAYLEANPERAAKAKRSFAEWALKNPERDKKNRSEYRRKNASKLKAKSYRWRHANPERYKAIHKKYVSANKVELNKKNAAHRKANPEHHKAIAKRSRIKHPETGRANRAKYRARKRGAKLGNQKVIVAWNKSWRSKNRVRCNWCQGWFSPKDCHADHIIPLNLGGAHSIENLCISCASCNHQKSDAPLSEWSARIPEPVLL